MPSKIKVFVLSIVIVTSLGVGLRLYAAPRLSIDVDERVYLQAALQYADFMRTGQWKMLIWNDFNFEHPPFYKIVYGVALLTQPQLEDFNPQEFIDGMAMYKVKAAQWGLADRYVSVLFGGLTVLAVALVNPIAGLFYAIDTLAVQFNSSLFLESLPTLASFLSALCYLYWYERIRQKSQPITMDFLWLGLSAGFLGISVASKYNYAVVGIAILIHFTGSVILKKNPSRDLWKLIAWAGLALLAFYICDPYIWKHPISNLLGSLTFHLNHPQSQRAQIANLPFYQPLIWFSAPFFKFSGNAFAIFPIKLDTLIGLLALAGLPRLIARKPFYFIWLIAGFLMLMAWPTKWVQYSMIVMVPFCISAAMGAIWLVDLLKNGLINWQKARRKASYI
jgi:hypothetical protein